MFRHAPLNCRPTAVGGVSLAALAIGCGEPATPPATLRAPAQADCEREAWSFHRQDTIQPGDAFRAEGDTTSKVTYWLLRGTECSDVSYDQYRLVIDAPRAIYAHVVVDRDDAVLELRSCVGREQVLYGGTVLEHITLPTFDTVDANVDPSEAVTFGPAARGDGKSVIDEILLPGCYIATVRPRDYNVGDDLYEWGSSDGRDHFEFEITISAPTRLPEAAEVELVCRDQQSRDDCRAAIGNGCYWNHTVGSGACMDVDLEASAQPLAAHSYVNPCADPQGQGLTTARAGDSLRYVANPAGLRFRPRGAPYAEFPDGFGMLDGMAAPAGSLIELTAEAPIWGCLTVEGPCYWYRRVGAVTLPPTTVIPASQSAITDYTDAPVYVADTPYVDVDDDTDGINDLDGDGFDDDNLLLSCVAPR